MIEIVPATKEHLLALYEEAPSTTVRAYAAIDGDRVLGLFGTYKQGMATIAFMKLTEELKKNKKVIVRASKICKTLLKGNVSAICDPNIDKAKEFLEHYGFKQYENEVYVWKA